MDALSGLAVDRGLHDRACVERCVQHGLCLPGSRAFVSAGFAPPAALLQLQQSALWPELKDLKPEQAKQAFEARYVRVVAKNFGVCPDWHLGKGGNAWIFADEIEVDVR